MNQLKLHIPTENELEYRRRLISDEDTMAYNMGYGDNGGCTYHQTDIVSSQVKCTDFRHKVHSDHVIDLRCSRR